MSNNKPFQQPSPPREIKLESLCFAVPTRVGSKVYDVCEKYTGGGIITLHAAWVLIEVAGIKHMVPLSNISSGILA